MIRALALLAASLLVEACASAPPPAPAPTPPLPAQREGPTSVAVRRSLGTGGRRLSGSFESLPKGSMVCVDTAGAPSLKTGNASQALGEGWRYEPFVLHGQAVPFCDGGGEHVILDLTAGSGGTPLDLRVGSIPLPLDVKALMARRKIAHLDIMVLVSVSESGQAAMARWVGPEDPPPEVKTYYEQQIATWRYEPFRIAGEPVPFVKAIQFRYYVDR